MTQRSRSRASAGRPRQEPTIRDIARPCARRRRERAQHAGARQIGSRRVNDAAYRAGIDFDQRPICGIAQHSVYGEKAAAGSPRQAPRRIS
jgi:hypothetical protein